MTFPKDLQIDIDKITLLESEDMQQLFNKAQEYGILDEFSDWFWTALSLVSPPSDDFVLQRALLWLEEYKRHLGRAYNNCKNKSIADKYNQLEIFLQQFAMKFKLTRKSQRYVLSKLHPLQDVSSGQPGQSTTNKAKYLVKSRKSTSKSETDN